MWIYLSTQKKSKQYNVNSTPNLLVVIPRHTNTGQFKKKVTLSHVYNEVASEPTITRYTKIARKSLKVCS
jgi:hypothetical protein